MLPAECPTVLEQQQMDLVGPEFQSVLDMSSLLKLNVAGDHMKDDREGMTQRSEHSYTEQSLFCNYIQQ